jgi:hypothetical protein
LVAVLQISKFFVWVVFFGLASSLAACAQLDSVAVSPEASVKGKPAETTIWQPFALPGKRLTRYDMIWQDGRQVVHAQADSSASMWRRPLRVAADQLGSIHFSWKVPQLIELADLSDGDAEDTPVRVVLAFEGDSDKLSMRNRMMFELVETLAGERPPYATLMYVWDTRAALETVLPAARSDRIRTLVVESGAQHCRRWLHYQRDIVADFQRAFGEMPGALVGIAVMTDADNTHSQTEAYYGPIELHGKTGLLARF